MKAPALVIAMPHKGGGDENDDEESTTEDDSDEMEAFDTFAEAIGVPDDKRQAAFDAFKAAVKACTSNY